MEKTFYKRNGRMTVYLLFVIISQFYGSTPLIGNGNSPFVKTKAQLSISELGFRHETGIYAEEFMVEISGKVISSSDELGIPGVNILIKGSSVGTVTDSDGTYSISVPNDNGVLIFSSIGFLTQEVSVNGRSIIDVILEEDLQSLDEVVIVGYGTQRKANLTGSVSSIGSEQLSKRTPSQASQLLQGVASGVTATQTSGEPGNNTASLNIRGMGTFSGAGNSPLVIVDGVPSDINSINPNDIESISVLKDAASAAIYGSRAANGVILIQTKDGKRGEMQINYEMYVGKQFATELPDYVDSWIYAEMKNEARLNMGQNPEFTQAEIDKFRSGEDPDNFPNKHHLRDLFNSGDGLQNKHNLTFKGGGADTRYLFSLGYLKQNGIIEQNEFDRYDIRLNVNSNLRENVRLGARLSGYESIRNRPAGITTNGARVEDITGVIQAANSYNATVPGRRSDGTFGTFMGHPVAEGHLASGSFSEARNTNISSIISLEWDIIESLKLSSRFSYRWVYSKSRLFGAEFVADENWSFGPSQADVRTFNSRNLLNDLVLDYDKTFGDHYVHALAGMSRESYDDESLSGFRDNFPSNNLHYLSAASPQNDRNSEEGSTWKILSYFGRINYSYKGKYLAEGNLRSDGSSRFAEGNRFGVFPSVSAAWNISEEDFFQIPWMEHFKVRGSLGKLGNQQIGTYPYQNVLTLGSIYVTGEDERFYPGIQLTNLPFHGITWETTRISNVGIDLSLFQGKLNFSGDYYYKLTDNILYNLSVSNVLGMTVGEQNAGEVENRGIEFELGHKNQMGRLSYSIFSNFSINHNKVLSLAGVDRDISKGLFVGESMQSIFGYRTDGLFLNEEDIANYPTQNYLAKPGFPRFMDLSGPNGEPDGRINAADDRTIIGNLFPKYSFGMGLTVDYQSFDFFLQLQGQAGLQKLIGGKQLAFNNNGNIQQWHIDNRWTEDNPDRDAEYPRLEMALHEPPWDTVLDYWTRDASFLRVKNIQLGYTFLPEILSRTFIDHFRIFVSGENITSFDHYYPGWDPEMTTTGGQNPSYYPITGLWSLGVNVQF
ncbi:SusC/RagA family TonB-linked outer membrane protein [Lunatibacter salilacus]|uniref:SusC/RagA family TonB-linked outer membrane protein n=1 Tax=Lunatibacter salilacus TaxID=2483804 RepID=UPI00131CF35D|nr:TonB-dependent receptor [Lunatibacter salilacus]